jgi:hypothetical protein
MSDVSRKLYRIEREVAREFESMGLKRRLSAATEPALSDYEARLIGIGILDRRKQEIAMIQEGLR